MINAISHCSNPRKVYQKDSMQIKSVMIG